MSKLRILMRRRSVWKLALVASLCLLVAFAGKGA